MRRLAFIAALFLAACSSSSSQGPKATIAAPDVDIDQALGPGDLGFPDAPIDVKYQIRVRNNAAVPITLRRVNLHTVNPPGGAYTLTPPLVHTMNVTIPPSGEQTIEVWAHARSYGVSMRDREPVTVKGVAYFETPQGYYNQILDQEIQQ